MQRDLRASERSKNILAESLAYANEMIDKLQAKVSEIEPLRQRADFLAKDLERERKAKETFKQMAIERGRMRKTDEQGAQKIKSNLESKNQTL